eukprot:GHVO01003632.1.p1 GENE.GHVO01003632.1~~GHVO01003632.1.p1  ORF type:complete len:189 (-),score=45.84 GHVO01003632.1:102-668(-)
MNYQECEQDGSLQPPNEKIGDEWAGEFNQLLATQLDSQREFHEQQRQELDEEVTSAKITMSKVRDELRERRDLARSRYESMEAEIDTLNRSIAEIDGEYISLKAEETRSASVLQIRQNESDDIQKVIDQERAELIEKIKGQKDEIEQLKQEKHDLQFHVESTKELKKKNAKGVTMIIGERAERRRRRK